MSKAAPWGVSSAAAEFASAVMALARPAKRFTFSPTEDLRGPNLAA
jgi:hypothetical protein